MNGRVLTALPVGPILTLHVECEIDAYLSELDEPKRSTLQQLRDTIREIEPTPRNASPTGAGVSAAGKGDRRLRGVQAH